MTIDWQLKAGLVVGLEASSLIFVDDEDPEDAIEVPVWFLHLGPLEVVFIFN